MQKTAYNRIHKVEIIWDQDDICDVTFFFEDNPDEPQSITEFAKDTKTRKYLDNILRSIEDCPTQ